MSLQYLIDESGETTGVFIPIEEWNEILTRLGNSEEILSVPEWQKEVVRSRLAKSNRSEYVSWDKVKQQLLNKE